MEDGSWVVIVAALLSGGLGAIAGGYMTTRMRGNIERQEAWRSRLIEAVDSANQAIVAALWKVASWLPRMVDGIEDVHDDDGALRPEVASVIHETREQLNRALSAVARVELLFGRASMTYVHAESVIQLERRMLGLLEGDEQMKCVLEAVVSERSNPGAGAALLDLHPDLDQCRREIALAEMNRPYLVQAQFVPAVDTNVAAWARVIHAAAGDHAHQFMKSAHDEIYRVS